MHADGKGATPDGEEGRIACRPAEAREPIERKRVDAEAACRQRADNVAFRSEIIQACAFVLIE